MDDEEKEGELSPEKQKKYNELMNKTRELMSEAVDIVSSDEDKAKFEERFRELFKKHNIPWMFSNLKVFASGLEFGGFLAQNMEMFSHATMHLQNLVNKMGKDIKSKTKHIV